MPTFGPYQFTSATDVGDNSHSWENVGNAVDSENITAASSFTESSAEDEFTDLDTNTLRLSGFTAPPAYATIDGVSVSIRIANAQTGAVWSVQCRRSSDGATSATKTHTNNTSGGTVITLGSPTDAWGNEFGVGDAPSEFDQIDIVCTDTADNYSTQDAYVYDAEISITYTLPNKMHYGSDNLPDTDADKIKYGSTSIKRIIFDGSIIWQDLNPQYKKQEQYGKRGKGRFVEVLL